MLRYAKVNDVRDRTVVITGVNPPTGKHITYVFETISDEKLLRSLIDARRSDMFLKVFVGEQGEPDFKFGNEEPPRDREDSYFTFFSYAKNCGYNPLFLRELDHYLVTMSTYGKPVKEIGRYLLNVTEKLGNVLYARDRITEMNYSKSYLFREIRYHITNAIIHSKACIDALATILNEVYGIGYKKGKIDLSTIRSDLLHKLQKYPVGKRIKKYEKWINKVTVYRDFVIHKIMLVTPPIGKVKKSPKPIQIVKCKVPTKPITINDAEKRIQWIDAEDYCQELIDNLENLIEIVGSDLLSLIKSRTYFPI